MQTNREPICKRGTDGGIFVLAVGGSGSYRDLAFPGLTNGSIRAFATVRIPIYLQEHGEGVSFFLANSGTNWIMVDSGFSRFDNVLCTSLAIEILFAGTDGRIFFPPTMAQVGKWQNSK